MGSGNPLLIEQLVRIFFEQNVVTLQPDGTAAVFLSRLDDIDNTHHLYSTRQSVHT